MDGHDTLTSALVRRSLGHWIWVITAVLVALWFVGVARNVGGDGIHLLLVMGVAVLGYELWANETPA